MPLRAHPVRASVGVTDIARAVAFYEGVLGLEPDGVHPSADIEEGGRSYPVGGGTVLNVFETPSAGSNRATVATFYVDDLDEIVDELTAAGAEFERYDGFGQDARGIGPRAGGGRIAWVCDPDGSTLAIEADA